MTGAAASQPSAFIADLRHRLRTPLNHIVGYTELLSEDLAMVNMAGGDMAGVDAATGAELETIRANAQQILAIIQQRLASAEDDPYGHVERLRSEMSEPLMRIMRSAATLALALEGAALLDLARINTAAADLLAFSQHAETGTGKGAVTPRPFVVRGSAASGSPARLLIVDDNELSCDVLARQLERDGHTVTCVENGLKALAELESTPFDLVLLDVMMPGMSGFEVLSRIKATPALSGTPVIMMSALDELESAARCIQMGAEDYLLKPGDPVLLGARLHSALERRQLHEAEQERTRELEKAGRELKRANEDLHRFAFAASHDLQEPLRTVITSVQLFLHKQREQRQRERNKEAEFNEAESGDAESSGAESSNAKCDQPDFLNVAIEAARRMSHLISDLLAYSVASDANRVPEPVDSEAAIAEALTNLRQAIEESGATVVYDKLPSVLFERAQLCQVFQNLIGNAIKYRGESAPEIHTGAIQSEGGEWTFSIRDNGIGIDAAHLHTIFEPFRRLHGRDLPGTGLGLTICRRSIEGFGGRIWVESKPGEGSIFLFTLKAAQSEGN